MSLPRLSCAGLAALTICAGCFNPDSGGDGSGPGTADSTGTQGSASASVTVSSSDTDSSSATTPGTVSATEATADATDTDPTEASAEDPSDTDPTATSDPDSSTGEVGVACDDGIVVAGEFCPVQPPELIPSGDGAIDTVLADLNGDGTLDTATLSLSASTVTVMLSDGAGAFETPLVLDVAADPCSIAAVDGEGDGDIDLAVLGAAIVSLVNDGDGNFQRIDSDNVGFGCSDHNNIDVLNNDGGALDVVYSGAYNNTYQPGIATGGWQFGTGEGIGGVTEGSSGVTVTEFAFDADNTPDVIVLNQYFTTFEVFAGDNMGAFGSVGVFDGCAGLDGAGGSRFATTGDLDGDDAIDIVVTCMQGNFAIVRGTANASFMAPVEVLLAGAHEPVLADVDNDDDLDLVVSSTTQQAVLVYINEDGMPADPIALDVPGEPRGVAVGDLDGDGAPEITAAVAAMGGSGLAVFRMTP